jgi:vanillate O-demethylase monooxygenase subunit
MWLRNCWYVIAWDYEIPADGFLARTVLGEPLLVYRISMGHSAGQLVVLEDRCCHRQAPLSKGRREGDAIRCGYHGLKFDAQGICIEVPGLDKAPPGARVTTYPVVEHNKWVFVWMGDASRADTAMLPDNFSNSDPGWHYKPGYMHYDTPYLLICDNLLDFSHLSYVHENTLGGSPAIAQARPQIERVTDKGQRGLRVTRRVPNVPPPPYYCKIQPLTTNIDRWFIYDFLFPATLLMKSGGRPVADAEDDFTNAVQLHSCQTLTPETENSTHYFFQQSHQTGKGDESVTNGIYNSLVMAFNEDRDMITAQHRNLNPGAVMLPLWMDAALVQWRKLLEQECLQESSRRDLTITSAATETSHASA